jgi:hypothetical protein
VTKKSNLGVTKEMIIAAITHLNKGEERRKQAKVLVMKQMTTTTKKCGRRM